MRNEINCKTKEEAFNFMSTLVENNYTCTISKRTNSYKIVFDEKEENDAPVNDYCKGKRKIPKWSKKEHGVPYKIIRAFFLTEIGGVSDYNVMKNICCDIRNQDLYIGDPKQFDVNMSQMRYDSQNSHGHIFNVKGLKVTLWDEIESVMYTYKEEFIK